MRQAFEMLVWLTVPLVFSSTIAAVQVGKPIASTGKTVITAVSGKLDVQVTIIAHQVPIGQRSDASPEVIRVGCPQDAQRCSLVDNILILVGDKLLFVPPSVFGDLAEPHLGHIKVDEKKLYLTISGGDASESYILSVEFDAHRITRRTLESGIAPGKPLQETIYYPPLVVGD
jgi:hypothetical protein